MMPASAAGRLLFTGLFAAAALGAALSPARAVLSARRPRSADWTAAGFCAGMCTALIAMTWWAEPAGAVWLQVAAFSGAALWLLLIGPLRTGLHHALMAAAMTWMLTAVPARASVPVLVGSGLVATCCVATPILWVTGSLRFSEAAMSVGMAAMVVAML